MARQPSRRDVAIFKRQLATLVGTGVPMHTALDGLCRQYGREPLGQVLNEVRRSLSSGMSLSNAMAREGEVFGTMYVALVRAGEAQGDIDNTLNQLANWLERDQALRERVKSALTYPMFVLAITLILTWLIFSFVLPAFMPMFSQMGGGVPLVTRVLMILVSVASSVWLMGLVGLILLAAGWLGLQWMRTPSGQAATDRMLLRVPLSGPLTRKVVLSRVSRSLATMLSSGVPIMDALLQTSRTCGNSVYRADLEEARENLKKGMSLTQHFALNASLYPAMLVQMCAAAEEAGKMDELMEHAAKSYDLDVEYGIELFLTLLEPMMMGFLAFIVGFIVLAVFLPLYGFLTRL
jgi:type IV pilus assembly protein PilC